MLSGFQCWRKYAQKKGNEKWKVFNCRIYGGRPRTHTLTPTHTHTTVHSQAKLGADINQLCHGAYEQPTGNAL